MHSSPQEESAFYDSSDINTAMMSVQYVTRAMQRYEPAIPGGSGVSYKTDHFNRLVHRRAKIAAQASTTMIANYQHFAKQAAEMVAFANRSESTRAAQSAAADKTCKDAAKEAALANQELNTLEQVTKGECKEAEAGIQQMAAAKARAIAADQAAETAYQAKLHCSNLWKDSTATADLAASNVTDIVGKIQTEFRHEALLQQQYIDKHIRSPITLATSAGLLPQDATVIMVNEVHETLQTHFLVGDLPCIMRTCVLAQVSLLLIAMVLDRHASADLEHSTMHMHERSGCLTLLLSESFIWLSVMLLVTAWTGSWFLWFGASNPSRFSNASQQLHPWLLITMFSLCAAPVLSILLLIVVS